MRDDHKLMLKKIKQQIKAFCLKHNKIYPGNKSKWTQAHVKWLNGLELDGYLQYAFNEYMITYHELTDKVERLNAQIEQLADLDEYRVKVKKLICIKGIKTHTALSLIVETGDFSRFESAERYASYIGLVPGEHSSSEDQIRLSITKAGNRHMRMLLTEAAQSYSRGVAAQKSKDLKTGRRVHRRKLSLMLTRLPSDFAESISGWSSSTRRRRMSPRLQSQENLHASSGA